MANHRSNKPFGANFLVKLALASSMTSVLGIGIEVYSLYAEPFEVITLETVDSATKYSFRAQDLQPELKPISPKSSSKPQFIAETTPEIPSSKLNPQEWKIDGIQTDFSYLHDNYGLSIYSVEPSISWRYDNNHKFNLKSGFINFSGQPGFQSVTIYPIRLGWEGRVEQVAIKTGATFYTFDRLAPAFGFDANVTIPVLPNLYLGASLERTPMKLAPSMLEIPEATTYTSYGPNIFWQIDRDSSLLSFLSVYNLNDGNRGLISFSRLKRNFGQFSIAANLVTTSYDRDAFPNYFSPSDYLIYNGEIGWQGDLTDSLNLRAQINLGQQRLKDEYSRALYYEAQLTAKLLPTIDAILNYSFGDLSNVGYYRFNGQDSVYSRYLITGQLKMRF